MTSFVCVDPWQRGAQNTPPACPHAGACFAHWTIRKRKACASGQRVFFFSWKYKMCTTINKKSIWMSSQAYCLKLCSLWILFPISSFQLISQGIFTENIIVSHNIVGNVFSPLTSGSLLPFSPGSCFVRRIWPEEEGLDNYYSEEPWKSPGRLS